MIASLGEVEALVRKAARGAGWTWGHAEELGTSARALSSAGLPGVALGAALLRHHSIGHCPIRHSAEWSDSGSLPSSPVGLQCMLLAMPLLGLNLCNEAETIVAIWPGGSARADCHGSVHCESARVSSSTIQCRFQIDPGPPMSGACIHPGGVHVAGVDWSILEQLALDSYVPASEQSRQGAGPTD